MSIKLSAMLFLSVLAAGCKMSDFDVFKGKSDEEMRRHIEMERALQMYNALEEVSSNKYETVGSDKE